jgi:hypothetical protein
MTSIDDSTSPENLLELRVERFQAKWSPVRVKKTRQIGNLELLFDFIETVFKGERIAGPHEFAARR